MRIAIGSDHAAYKLKTAVERMLDEMGHQYDDHGAFTDEHPSDDYPLVGAKVAEAVVQGRAEMGILMCGTGIGMSIAANKVPGARAALCNDLFTAQKSREHNDANVLVLGSRVVGEDLAKEIIRVWMRTAYAHGRHESRNAFFRVIEEKYCHRE